MFWVPWSVVGFRRAVWCGVNLARRLLELRESRETTVASRCYAGEEGVILGSALAVHGSIGIGSQSHVESHADLVVTRVTRAFPANVFLARKTF